MWCSEKVKKCFKTTQESKPLIYSYLEITLAIEEQVLQYMYQNEDQTWGCSVCGKIFKAKRDLKRHIESLHVENHPGYSCDICGEIKKSQNALRQHKNVKHTLH